jgi:hypothetical protein
MPAGGQAVGQAGSQSVSQSAGHQGFDRFVSGASEGIDAAVNASEGRCLCVCVVCWQ